MAAYKKPHRQFQKWQSRLSGKKSYGKKQEIKK